MTAICSGGHFTPKSHQGAVEVRLCPVQAGAAAPISTHVDVIHQAVAIQEALPCDTHGHPGVN